MCSAALSAFHRYGKARKNLLRYNALIIYNQYMKILFVCSSNICRSPFCEYVFRRAVNSDPELASKVESVRSAAVFNRSFRIHPKARLALLREGFSEEEIAAHKPAFKWGDGYLFREADLIIGMTRMNKIALPLRYHKKFVTLSEYVDGYYTTIPDPFLMKNIDDYYAVMDLIKGFLTKLAEKIKSE